MVTLWLTFFTWLLLRLLVGVDRLASCSALHSGFLAFLPSGWYTSIANAVCRALLCADVEVADITFVDILTAVLIAVSRVSRLWSSSSSSVIHLGPADLLGQQSVGSGPSLSGGSGAASKLVADSSVTLGAVGCVSSSGDHCQPSGFLLKSTPLCSSGLS